jgi:hypothetical protein
MQLVQQTLRLRGKLLQMQPLQDWFESALHLNRNWNSNWR